MVNVLVLRGEEGTKRAWAAYRQARTEAGLPKVMTDHFAYAALVYVGDTHEEGVEIGSKLLWFLNTSLEDGAPVRAISAWRDTAAFCAAGLPHRTQAECSGRGFGW